MAGSNQLSRSKYVETGTKVPKNLKLGLMTMMSPCSKLLVHDLRDADAERVPLCVLCRRPSREV